MKKTLKQMILISLLLLLGSCNIGYNQIDYSMAEKHALPVLSTFQLKGPVSEVAVKSYRIYIHNDTDTSIDKKIPYRQEFNRSGLLTKTFFVNPKTGKETLHKEIKYTFDKNKRVKIMTHLIAKEIPQKEVSLFQIGEDVSENTFFDTLKVDELFYSESGRLEKIKRLSSIAGYEEKFTLDETGTCLHVHKKGGFEVGPVWEDTITYKCDTTGLLVLNDKKNSSSSHENMSIKKDKRGNWIKWEVEPDKYRYPPELKVISVTERSIRYY